MAVAAAKMGAMKTHMFRTYVLMNGGHYLNGEVQQIQDLVENVRRSHQTRVRSSSDNTTQRIPGAIVHPVQKLVRSGPSEELGRSVVEPRIILMNNLDGRGNAQIPIRSEPRRTDGSRTIPDKSVPEWSNEGLGRRRHHTDPCRRHPRGQN